MVGETLKKKREELGLDLKEVAHNLRIQYGYLKAIENNEVKKLPPDVYTRAYIREYAKFLTIDSEPLLDEYVRQQVDTHSEVQSESPPLKKFTLPWKILLIPFFTIIIVISIIYFPKTGSVRKASESPVTGVPSSVHEEPRVFSQNASPLPKHNMLTATLRTFSGRVSLTS